MLSPTFELVLVHLPYIGVIENAFDAILSAVRLNAVLEDLHDELAIKLKWSIMGHAGLKPCLLCANVLMKGHSAVSSHPDLRDLAELDPSGFILCSNEELWNEQDKLVEQYRHLKNAELQTLETACGQRCEPLGLMACKELRPFVKPCSTGYDSWHCYFVSGAAENELDMFVTLLLKSGFTTEDLENFTNEWLPTQKLRFTDTGLKGMASDVLRAVFLIWHFCLAVLLPRGLLLAEVASFCALAEVCKCLQDIKLYERVPQWLLDRLGELQKTHSDLFKQAYGTQHVKPKHHYALHLIWQILQKGMLIDTATSERKERLLKAELEKLPRCDATKNIDIHITVGINLSQIDEMEHGPSLGSLVGPTSATVLAGGMTSFGRTALTRLGTTVKAGDPLVLSAKHLVLVIACMRDDAGLAFLVRLCTLQGKRGAANVWHVGAEHLHLREPEDSHIHLVSIVIVFMFCICLS